MKAGQRLLGEKMEYMKKGLLWYYLLQKRLIKKYSFLVLLCMIPCFAWGIWLVAGQESGVVTVALCEEEPDMLSEKWMRELVRGKSMLRFVRVKDPQEGEHMVRTGKADCAWIFCRNAQEKARQLIRGRKVEGGLVTVLVREDNVAYRMAREKLYGTLYPELSYLLYQNFIRENPGEAGSISQERAEEIYRENIVSGSLFKRSYVNSKEEEHKETEHYLIMPVRGLLAVLIAFMGLAGAMYLMQDRENGIFGWMKIKNRVLFCYGYYLPAVAPAGLMVLIALKAEGVFVTWKREIPLMALYLLMTVSFCEVVRRICRRKEWLCMVTPVILCLMLAVCPVFQDFKALRSIQRLFPAFYYLQGLYNDKYFVDMILYSIIAMGISGLLKEEQR